MRTLCFSRMMLPIGKSYNITILKLFILWILFLPLVSAGQLQFVPFDSISVMVDDVQLKNPWAGGLNSPQFSIIDLNGDGIDDLFVFERNWNGITKTFINNGTYNEVDYKYNSLYSQGFPEMHNWALLADYNCDGKFDIFTSVPAGIAVYKNDTEPLSPLKFTLVTPLLQALTSEGLRHIYVSPPDLPSLADIDGDGDLDILSFDEIGRSVSYYQNMSMEKYDNCQALEYELQTKCWGYFSESSQDNDITLFDTCSGNSIKTITNARHAGSALLSVDMDGNGLKDLILGDISFNNMVLLSNNGSANEASMTNADYSFPSNTTPVDLTVFPAAYYINVNNDNKKDLLISPNNPNTSQNFNNILLYTNIGSEEIPVFEYSGNSFLQDQMIDVGEGACPVFFDANADGLLDIIIGNYGYFIESGVISSKLALLINTGTPANPSFELVTRDYTNVSALNFNGVYPAFGDLDGDGDEDMITGDNEGNIHMFINTAEPGDQAAFVLNGPVYMNIDVGETAMPQIVDVNNDGKLDLLIGEKSGTINYFENTGTLYDAFFSSNPTNDFFGEIEIMPDFLSGYSSPFLTNDSLGQLLLYVGSEDGWLYQYNNIENNLSGSFNLTDSLFLNGLNVCVSGADINDNGDMEIIYGEYAGGISIMRKGIPQWLSIDKNISVNINASLFPNPANSNVKLIITGLNTSQIVDVMMFNNMGQKIWNDRFYYSGEKLDMNITGNPKGIYFVKIQSEDFVIIKKLIIN